MAWSDQNDCGGTLSSALIVGSPVGRAERAHDRVFATPWCRLMRLASPAKGMNNWLRCMITRSPSRSEMTLMMRLSDTMSQMPRQGS